MPTTRLGKSTWGLREARAVVEGKFNLIPANTARESLERELNRIGFRSPMLLTNRASVGLKLALEEMRARRPHRDVVVVPAYCCPAVPDAVRAAGLRLRAAPVTPDLNLDLDRLDESLSDEVLAVVGVHMYGLPLDTVRLREQGRGAGVFVVDDAAHLVAPPYGLEGDVGILSFNQSKTLTGGSPHGGGALFVSNDELRPAIARRVAALPEGSSRARAYLWFVLRFGLENAPRALTEYFGGLDEPLGRFLGADSRLAERMSAAAALVVLEQTKRLDDIVAGRAALTGHYLAALPTGAFVQTERPRYLSRMLVRWENGPTATVVRERLARRGLATRLPYPMWTDPDDPTAEFIRNVGETHLELPGSPSLDAAAVDKIAAAWLQALRQE